MWLMKNIFQFGDPFFKAVLRFFFYNTSLKTASAEKFPEIELAQISEIQRMLLEQVLARPMLSDVWTEYKQDGKMVAYVECFWLP